MAKAEATDFLQRLDEIMGKTDVSTSLSDSAILSKNSQT